VLITADLQDKTVCNRNVAFRLCPNVRDITIGSAA